MINSLFKKNVNISRRFIIMLVMINFLVISLYYTYSIFVIKQVKDDISLISVRQNYITMTSTDLTDNAITVNANTSVDVTFSLSNSLDKTMYYRIMHKGVPTGVAIYEKNNDDTSHGSIEGSATNTSVLTINNTTSASVNVNFLLQESFEEYFDKDLDTSYVNVEMNFDHSGAHKPYFSDNMIPVYYEPVAGDPDAQGVWKKADSSNTNSSYIWYDYDNFMWANAVTVSNSTRETYKSAEPGTTVNLSDINAFFVWIPGYKYFVVSGNGDTSYEKLINVNFVSDEYNNNISYYSTVFCEESISTLDDQHLYSEVCTDEKYGSVQNNLSTYYHPAFNGKYEGGFWIGKYANANKSGYNIKPNTSTTSSYVVTGTSYVRQMTKANNIYGFDANPTIDNTTWVDISDNADYNAHPITSMEWGAVAILANSPYGKSGNPMYQTDTIKSFTRIYNNANDAYSGRSTYYTTSSQTVNNTSTSTAYYYDLTDLTHTTNSVVYPVGYRGAGASTTGTIYGVYDMSGGNNTVVMGVFMNEDGTSPYTMNSEYYTAYSYVPYNGKLVDTNQAEYLEVFRLGDGIKEHVRNYREKGMWQDGTITFGNKGIMLRGGHTTSGSLFTTEITYTPETSANTFTVLQVRVR